MKKILFFIFATCLVFAVVIPVNAVQIWSVGSPRDSNNAITGPVQLFTFDSSTQNQRHTKVALQITS